MVEQNTTTFSNFKKPVPEIKIKETEEQCNKHNVNLVKLPRGIFAGRVICPVCAKELTDHHSEELAKKETDRYYSRNRLWLEERSLFSDGTLKKASFDNYDTEDAETKRNKYLARQIAGSYLNGETFNTIFTGNVGTGKSHLAMSMLRAVNDHSPEFKRCLFVSVDQLILLLRDSYKSKEGQTENQLRTLCIDADLLVLDDLGAEVGAISTESNASNDVVRMINAIMNGRMDKATIFTTNLGSKQLRTMYDPRITSRILKGVNKERIIKFTNTRDKRNHIEF